MDSSDEEVLLEPCFLLNYHQEQIKRKRKKTWVREIFKNIQNKEFTIIYCSRCVSVIENRISGYLYNQLFSESNEEKRTAFQSMPWSLIIHKNTIKNCSTALQAFFSRSFSFCTLYFLFHKGKGTSGILQPSVQHFVHVFPIFFRFHKCFNNFHLGKNIFINNFFH